ncbi:PEGA domain-containing protein [Pseudoalteromonas sp. SR44-5]|uniref:PEGA domain-containing protein n=1 Tax=Pseudoalteromonas rhizosphaerae TaxID=2518973 RepID=A0ABW8L227_9GAMM|nr:MULTISPECIES: PEGA domain-containing protein [unclassified Pseudoalteromonas]MBB1335075.1 PEGA domain-containing protein [Pseudoalteromonas sp. SR41-6]MBB1343248.1 PEGA domain-containing protein [Pseudoalteromonas sp. SR45-6]MBB1368067.1 PEGA domain-containing protein [Pseudoalteromonas sp. SR44-5]MBB1420045.1 PEGA domain-containing protein [Pseudoalteromonas sp. SG44-1]MBB1424585.1 PEGA domain-containing protein [Pseudoalteromonas sp. SG43-7]
MKKLSALVAIVMLSGCSSSPKVEQQAAPVEQPVVVAEEVNSAISLTVITSPDDARIRIMNIKPKYEAGIELDEGKYDIEVTKDGYLTYRKWVTVDKKTILTIELDQIEASQSAL